MGRVLRDGVEVTRWAEYSKLVLNVEEVREANINLVGNRCWENCMKEQ